MISDEDMQTIRDASNWFRQNSMDAMQAAKDSLKNMIQKDNGLFYFPSQST